MSSLVPVDSSFVMRLQMIKELIIHKLPQFDEDGCNLMVRARSRLLLLLLMRVAAFSGGRFAKEPLPLRQPAGHGRDYLCADRLQGPGHRCHPDQMRGRSQCVTVL